MLERDYHIFFFIVWIYQNSFWWLVFQDKRVGCSHRHRFSCSWFVCVFQAPGYGDVRLSVHSIPDVIELEKTFELACKVINCWWDHLTTVCITEFVSNKLTCCTGLMLGQCWLALIQCWPIVISEYCLFVGSVTSSMLEAMALTNTYYRRSYFIVGIFRCYR